MESEKINDDVIETDNDTPEEYNTENAGLYPYDPIKMDIDIRESPYTVFELKRRCDQKKIILDPEFQRNPNVWSLKQKSKFIESIILNFPLPYWYVTQTRNGEYIVVDGLQRTLAIRDFMNNEFKLTGLEALSHLNTLNFEDLKKLQGDYETRIEDKKISLYVIQHSASSVIYDIFNRVNTGGTKLERQEIRNCIFTGKSTRLLKKLSEEEYFKQAIDGGFSPKRMKDRELILRYLAFKICDNYRENYRGNMNDFLEETMEKINLMSEDEIDRLTNDFERVMVLTYDFFGKENFRLPQDNNRGKVNMIMFESISYFFSKQNDRFLEQNKETIKQNFMNLRQDQEYVNSIKRVRNDRDMVTRRFDLAQEILGDI